MPHGIREATETDVPILEVIRRQALEAGLTSAYDRTDFAPLIANEDRRLPDWIASPDTMVLIGETDVTPIGFGVFDRPSARIEALYTATEYQGRGCGSALLERFESVALEDGQTSVRTTAPHTAVGFFESRGFERRHLTDALGIEMIVLEKPFNRSESGSGSPGSAGAPNHR